MLPIVVVSEGLAGSGVILRWFLLVFIYRGVILILITPVML
jgi:hypothetical protein